MQSFFSAILLLGGQGSRFGGDLPKQFLLFQGKKLFLYPLQTLLDSKLFQEIILVVPSSFVSQVTDRIQPFPPSIRITVGGDTRQQSSYQGLLACSPFCEYVLIHDAARPFVSHKILQENIKQVKMHQAVDTCIPCTDTIVFSTPQKSQIEQIPPRSLCFRGQTPQTFSYPLICRAHQKAQRNRIENATDDCQLVFALPHPVHLVAGEESNFKITTPQDLQLAESLIQQPLFTNH